MPIRIVSDGPEEWRKLSREYTRCEGFRIRNELQAARTYYEIFAANHEELKEVLSDTKNPVLWSRIWGDVTYRRHLQREVIRRLHNYVAAARSMVEHTRKFVRQTYSDTALVAEYQAQVDQRFSHSPLCNFVQDLRNFVLHKNPQAVRLTMTIRKDDLLTRSFTSLDLDRLREWDRWSDESLQYMEELAKNADLEPVIDAYMSEVASFQTWYGNRLKEEHREALEEMYRLEKRLREMLPGKDPNWGDPWA